MKSKTLLLCRKLEYTPFPFEHSVDTRRQKAVLEECTRLLDGSTGKLVDVRHMSHEKLVWLPDHEPSPDAAHARVQSTQYLHASLDLRHVARGNVQFVARVRVARARPARRRALILHQLNLVARLGPQEGIWAEPQEGPRGVP